MAQTKMRTEVALENAAEKMRKLELELGRKPSEMPLVSTIPLVPKTTDKGTTTTTKRNKAMRNIFSQSSSFRSFLFTSSWCLCRTGSLRLRTHRTPRTIFYPVHLRNLVRAREVDTLFRCSKKR